MLDTLRARQMCLASRSPKLRALFDIVNMGCDARVSASRDRRGANRLRPETEAAVALALIPRWLQLVARMSVAKSGGCFPVARLSRMPLRSCGLRIRSAA